MDTNEEKIAGTNLTTVPEYSQTAVGLAELSRRLKGLVFDVTTKQGMKQAKEARAEARKLRTTLEAKRKEIKAPALERCRQIDEEAKRITGEIVALEEPIALQIENEEARAEAERLAELKKEQDRVDGHKARIQFYRDLPGTMIGWPSSRIASALEKYPPIDEANLPDAEEFAQESDDAYNACRARIQEMLKGAKSAEEQAERVRQQEIELEQMRERNAQLEREAEERRQVQEREEQAKREAAEHAERERLSSITMAIASIRSHAVYSGRLTSAELADRYELARAENPELLSFDFAEFHEDAMQAWRDTCETLEATLNRTRQLEQEAAERAEADRIERQRLADEAAENARKAEQAEQERQEAVRKAEAQRRASLTIEKAATALLQRVQREGHGTWPEAIDLGEVLAKGEMKAKRA